MKISALLAFIVLTVAARAQTSINNYKYVLLPQRFSFLKTDDQYSLNSTTKSLLEQKGFTVLYTNGDLPASVAGNKCTALMADVKERKAMFSTNLTLELKDCSGTVLFKSKEGKSREKEFFMAYDGALRDALSSLNTLSYKYDSTAVVQSQSQPQQQPTPVTTTAPVTTAPPATPPPANPAAITGTLYAQVISNGYQLIDTSPKKVLTLLKTSTPDYYIAQSETSNGVVFKKDSEWIFEYYKDNKLVSQRLDIKF